MTLKKGVSSRNLKFAENQVEGFKAIAQIKGS